MTRHKITDLRRDPDNPLGGEYLRKPSVDDWRPVVDRLRYAICQRGLKQREVAERAGIRAQTLSDMLSYDEVKDHFRNHNRDNLPPLAKVLDVTVEWLVTGEGDLRLLGLFDEDPVKVGRGRRIKREAVTVTLRIPPEDLAVLMWIRESARHLKGITDEDKLHRELGRRLLPRIVESLPDPHAALAMLQSGQKRSLGSAFAKDLISAIGMASPGVLQEVCMIMFGRERKTDEDRAVDDDRQGKEGDDV